MASKLWAEIWTRPGDANYGRVVDDPLEVEGDFHDGLNQIGNGGMQLSNRSPYFDDILVADPDTPANSKSSTVKIFSEKDPTTPIFEWLPNQLFPSTSKNDPLVKVSGLGIKALPAHARLEPYDWDGTDDFIPAQPDWEWGADNLVTNWDFENNGIEPNRYTIEITATGGTFTLSDGTDTTSAIAFNAAPGTIATELQNDIAAITDVVAELTGTNPRTIDLLFVDPPFGLTITLNPASLTGGTGTITETEAGGLLPTGWNRAQDILFGVVQDKGNYDAFEISDAQNHTPGGTYSLLIDPGPLGSTSNRDAGAQTLVNVTPGAVHQTSIWVYPTSGTDLYRLGLFTESGELVASTDYNGQTLTVNTWNQLVIPDVLMPDNVDLVILRIQCLNKYPGNPSAFYVDDAELYAGFAPTTVGEMIRLIYDHAVDVNLRDPIVWDDGSGTDTPYLTLDFTDSLDSNGNAWDESDLKTKFTMRMSYSQIMASLARDFGYEYRIVADDVETGTYHWQVYNPGTMETDYTTAATPAIQGGAFDVRRNVNRLLPSGTDTMVEGLGRVTARARNTALMSALGRIEASRLNREAPDLTAAAEAADESIGQLLINSRSLNYILVDPPDEPMSDYIIGDLLVVDDPPEVVASPARFVDVTCSFTPNTTEWETQFGSARIINADAAVASAVSGLLAKFEYPFPEPTTLNIGGGGGGGAPTIVVAASDASEYSKEKADVICTGVDDHLEIQFALNEIDTGFGLGGRVLLTEGTFNCDYGMIRLSDNTAQAPVHLQGCGYATILNFNAGAGTAIDVNGDRSIVSNLRMEGNSINSTAGIDITGFDCLITGVIFTDFGTGSANIVVSNGGTFCRIIGNLFDNNLQNAISVTVNAGATVISGNIIISQPGILANGDNVEITGNYIGAETGISGLGDDVQVTGNFINYTADGITGNGIGWIISGNTFDGGSGWAITNLSAFGDSEWVISGNTIRDSLGIELQDLTTDTIIADNFFEDGQIILNGDVHNIAVRGNVWQTPVVDTVPAVIGFTGSLIDGVITDNLMDNAGGNTGVHIESGTDVLVANNQLKLTDVGIYLEACLRIVVSGNQVQWAGTHGIHISGSSLCTITGNKVFGSSVDTANTYDNIILDGDSDRNFISANQLGADTTIAARYGLNISANTCDITIAVGNDLGVVGDYGTDALNDAGTGTILNYPSHGTYGDNFT